MIYLKNNIATFKGGLSRYTSVRQQFISANTAALADSLIAQSKSISRFVFSRVFGRVN